MKGLPWFVYVMRDPRTNKVRKVGITQRPAFRIKTLMAQRKGRWNLHSEWATDMHAAGVLPEILIVHETICKSDARRVEIAVSAALRIAGIEIVNGEGRGRAKRAAINAI